MKILAVVIPAHNEESTIFKTVTDFMRALPDAQIVVCDNASNDNTAHEAIKAGAQVIMERRKGKGHAVRRLFNTVDADIYVMVDADTTYEPEAAKRMIDLLEKKSLDMVIGKRVHSVSQAYRHGHATGNKVFNWLFQACFKSQTDDLFSGYRVMTKRLISSLPIQSHGFEIETEISVVATCLNFSVEETDVAYNARPENSKSKLNTYTDGMRILLSFVKLMHYYTPLRIYGSASLLMMAAGLLVGYPVIAEFIETGLVPRLPSAVLATGLGIISMILMFSGLTLDSLARLRIEFRQSLLLHWKRI